MDLRSKLTYANVVATLALVLAVGGGTVYAALQLGKNEVKSKNIAKGAVKTSDLGADAVTGPKVKDGSIGTGDVQDGSIGAADIQDGSIGAADIVDGAIGTDDIQDGSVGAGDIAAGVIPQIVADVTGSATAGPQGGVNTNTTSPLPLSGTTSFTPKAGEVAALAAEGQFTIAATNAANPCSPAVFLFANGQPTRVFVSPESGQNSTTPVSATGHDADGPFGLLNPGTPITITAQLRGSSACTAGSQLNRLEVRILQIH